MTMRVKLSLILLLLGVWAVSAPPATAQDETLTGWFTFIVANYPPESGLAPQITYTLTEDSGEWYGILPRHRACPIGACRHSTRNGTILQRYAHTRIYEWNPRLQERGIDDILTRRIAVGQLGAGECAVLAVALSRNWVAGLQDKRARAEGRHRSRALRLCGTEDLMVTLLRSGTVTLAYADQLLVEWTTKHRFRLKIASFSELL